MKKVFIITGEHSGDMHAASVVKHLRTLDNNIQIEAIGGEYLKTEGIKLFSDHSKMSAVGLSPKIIVDHLSLGKRLIDYLTNEYKPDLVLLIDYGAFNLNIAKFLKKAKIKTYYYIPPQVWASRKWRINSIKKYIDKVLCIFPFEKTMYEEYDVNVHYCGHPLVSQLPPKANRQEFLERHGFDPNKKLVSIFPGSREFELKQLMKTFVSSAQKLKLEHSDLQFCISHAPNLKDKVFEKYLKKSDFKVIKGENHALLSASDALILASGTVALEAALYQTPMLIGYKGPWLLYLIYLMVRCIKNVSLPNIISGKSYVPELVQHKFTVDNICYETEKFLYDKAHREATINGLGEVKNLLSDKYSAQEVANCILEALE